MHTLKQIGRVALERLLSSARFRPQNKEDDFHITFSEASFELDTVVRNYYRRDHDTSYHADQNFMVWGIELGLKRLEVQAGYSFTHAIIEGVILDSESPLPSHLIVQNWSNSDFGGDMSYIVFRFNDIQDHNLRNVQEGLKARASLTS